MNEPGIIKRTEETGTFKRISIKLNYYGLVECLIKSGYIPKGFQIEHAFFDEEDTTVLNISLLEQIITK